MARQGEGMSLREMQSVFRSIEPCTCTVENEVLEMPCDGCEAQSWLLRKWFHEDDDVTWETGRS